MNNITTTDKIVVRPPASYDVETCRQLQDKAEQVYRLHGNKITITNHCVAIFEEFQKLLKEGYTYEIGKYNAFISAGGLITLTLTKPEAIQADEIKTIRAQAKADYEVRLEQEKEHQTQLLAEQQFQNYLRKKREAEQAEEDVMRAQFLKDAQSCFSKIKTNDNKDKK